MDKKTARRKTFDCYIEKYKLFARTSVCAVRAISDPSNSPAYVAIAREKLAKAGTEGGIIRDGLWFHMRDDRSPVDPDDADTYEAYLQMLYNCEGRIRRMSLKMIDAKDNEELYDWARCEKIKAMDEEEKYVEKLWELLDQE